MLSANYMLSAACHEEAVHAFKLELPTIAVVADSVGWSHLMQAPVGHYDFGRGEVEHNFRERVEVCCAKYFTQSTIVPQQGNITDNVFASLIEVSHRIQDALPKDETLYGVILCAAKQLDFATRICEELINNGLQCIVRDYAEIPKGMCALPVLSAEFMSSVTCYDAMRAAQQQEMVTLPITYKNSRLYPARERDERLCYLESIFNRANCVPPPQCQHQSQDKFQQSSVPSDFELDWEGNMQKLVATLQIQAETDSSPEAAHTRRCVVSIIACTLAS